MTERRRKRRKAGPTPWVMVSVRMHPDTELRIQRASLRAGESRHLFILTAANERADAILGPDPKRAA